MSRSYEGYELQEWNVLCHDCGYEWVAAYAVDRDELIAIKNGNGEECPECDSQNIEAMNEYNPRSILPLLIMIVPSLILNSLSLWGGAMSPLS